MKKGFTLVELIAVLVILSVIALIVTPNIMVSVKEYQRQVYETEVQAIKDSAKNWAADNISELPTNNEFSLVVTIHDLIYNGYYDSEVRDTVNGGTFEDENHFTFVIIDCDYIEDELGKIETNYKYTYNAYTSIDDFVINRAKKYAEENNITADTEITLNTLIEGGYINNHMYYTNWYKASKYVTGNADELVLNIGDIDISAKAFGKETKTYEYTITIS